MHTTQLSAESLSARLSIGESLCICQTVPTALIALLGLIIRIGNTRCNSFDECECCDYIILGAPIVSSVSSVSSAPIVLIVLSVLSVLVVLVILFVLVDLVVLVVLVDQLTISNQIAHCQLGSASVLRSLSSL